MRKSTLDIDKSDGNAMYRRFVRQFSNYVSPFCKNDPEQLTYLEQFITESSSSSQGLLKFSF